MNKDLLVEIFVPTTERSGWGAIGTGYPVAKDRILTARHVLFPPNRDPGKPIEIRWHHQTGETRQWREIADEAVLWSGDEHCDAAVIACPLPPDAGPWGALSIESPRPAEWESEGFPEVGKRDDGARVATAMQGHMHRMAKAASFFALDLNAGPNRDELLKGASGSPVMSEWKLLGVIVECPPHFDTKRLWAVPSCRLLEIPGFCKAIGHTPQTAALALLKEQIILELAASTDAMEALEATLPITQEALADKQTKAWATRLVEAVFGLTVEQLVPALRKVHRDLHMKQKTVAASAIAKASNTILPAVFDRAVVRTLQARMFDAQLPLVDLPEAATHTVAEIIMAGAEGRQVCFRKAADGNTEPVAIYRLQEPPTAGIDADFAHWTDDTEQSLANKFVARQYDHFLKPEDRCKMIANRLELEAEEQRTRYVACQFESDNDRNKAMNALMSLKERYPALVLLDLSIDGPQIVQESELFQRFVEILKTALEADP